MKAPCLSAFRAALLVCGCGLAVACQNSTDKPKVSANNSAPPTGTSVVLAEPSGAVAGTQSTAGSNVISVNPSDSAPVPLDWQLWWGMTHAADKISAADLVHLNAGNAPRRREEFASPAGQVRVTEYGELVGDFAARYIFAVLDASGTETGSIAPTSFRSPTQIAREMGRIGSDDRLFHLEDYRRPGNVGLLAAYRSEPAYDDVRRRVLALLSQ